MVSTVPKPQALATCSMGRWVLSMSRHAEFQAERFDVFGWADANLGFEQSAEVPFGQVGL